MKYRLDQNIYILIKTAPAYWHIRVVNMAYITL